MEEKKIAVVVNEEAIKINAAEDVVDLTLREIVKTVEISDIQIVEAEVDHAFAPLGNPNDMSVHKNLHGITDPDQHPITAITGLKAKLDSLDTHKNPQTVYSDKFGVANYYAWNDGMYHDFGYFVSFVPHTSTIQICEGADIFGVTIDSAGFIGGQDATIPRDDAYALVATSGVVDVRCEIDVVVGDCVISNAYGIATKTDSNCGYKVFSVEKKNGVYYAAISLGVQACTTDAIGQKVQHLGERMDGAETNIAAAINVANEAYRKANECIVSNENISNKVDDALIIVDNTSTEVGNLGAQVSNLGIMVSQAKTISENTAIFAESMKNEAVEKANGALEETSKLRDEFTHMDEGMTELEDQIAIIVKANSENGDAIAGIRTEVNDHEAKINGLVSWQGDTNLSMARIEQKADSNGAYIHSTVSNMDKYSVGPYSQAQGFTLDQAKAVLEVGMIYVPTVSHSGETYNTSYNFTIKNTYTWSGVTWIESVGKVVFSASIPSGNAYPLWYTNSSTVSNGYEPYTLYKLETYKNEAGNMLSQWVAVATLAGNSSNRAVSQIRQDANSIDMSVINMKGDVASSKQWISDNNANIQDVVSWKNDNASTIATTIQSASASEAYIAQIASVKNSDGSVNAAASIVAAVNEDESAVTINANKINFVGFTTFLRADDLGESGTTSIDGARIQTGTISADRIDVSNVITIGGIAKTSDIPTNVSQLNNDNGYQTESGVTTIVNGIVTTDYVNALGITAKDISATTITGKTISGGSLFIGDENNTYADITSSGVLTCKGGIFDNCTINETCTIKGVLTGNTIHSYSDSDHNMSGYIKFDLSENVFDSTYTIGLNNDPTATYIKLHADNKIDIYNYQNRIYLTDSDIEFDSYGGFEFNSLYNYPAVFNCPVYLGDDNLEAMLNNRTTPSEVSTIISNDVPTLVNSMLDSGVNVISADTCYLGANNTTNYRYGTWIMRGTEEASTSDMNYKNTINNLSDRYSILFDALKPSTFKFNDGTSDRLHVGFIAQEVEDAISMANLTTKDFAGLVIDKTMNEVTNEEEERYYLRYGEFVALNTNEIQKLKQRVMSTEKEISELKQLIAQTGKEE